MEKKILDWKKKKGVKSREQRPSIGLSNQKEEMYIIDILIWEEPHFSSLKGENFFFFLSRSGIYANINVKIHVACLKSHLFFLD